MKFYILNIEDAEILNNYQYNNNKIQLFKKDNNILLDVNVVNSQDFPLLFLVFDHIKNNNQIIEILDTVFELY